MKRAIISDIHGNFSALSSVLSKIDTLGVDEIICLGDIIGYGPEPLKCLDTVIERCKLTILGNHDQAAIFDPEGFNPVAMRAIMWTRQQLEDAPSSQQADLRWDFLGELPRRHDEGLYLFVHGSPRDPTNEYVFPEMGFNKAVMNHFMGRFERTCFQGHTHIPGRFTEAHGFQTPEELGDEFSLTEDKCMINVGSVGQPRDENPKSCFVVLDTDADTARFYRQEYNIDETANKIFSIPDLDNMLGERLKFGR